MVPTVAIRVSSLGWGDENRVEPAWLARIGRISTLAGERIGVVRSTPSVPLGFFACRVQTYELSLPLWAVADRQRGLVETQQIEDLAIFERFSLQWLDVVEHVLRQPQVFVLHGLHALVVFVHFEDRALLQA